MTHTAHRPTERAPAPKTRITGWVWISLAVIVAAALATVFLWPDDASDAPVFGDLTWSRLTDVPSDEIYTVTATPEGFLAASAAPAGGVDFWTTTDGQTWELLTSDRTAFEADEVVFGLSRGPSGFVAVATSLPEAFGLDFAPTTVWTSSDGETWHRSELTAGLSDTGTPYLRHWFEVTETVSGPNGFVARGMSMLAFDTEAILADFAPEASTAHYMVGELPSKLQISTEDGTELELTYTELGITPEQRNEARAAVPSPLLWWSADGVSWTPVDMTEIRAQFADARWSPDEGVWMENLVGSDDGFYLFAGPELGFRSTDGRTWTPFEMQGLPAEFDYRVSAIEGGLILFGGETEHDYFGGGPGEQSVWTSPDGQTWSQAAVELPAGLGPDLDIELQQVTSGPLGILARGTPMRPRQQPEVVVRGDDYALTLGSSFWILTEQSTDELIAEIDMETMSGGDVVVEDDEGTLIFMDRTTQETLLVVTPEDIWMAEEQALATVGSGSPVVVKDGYTVLMHGDTWIVADEATGEVIASYQGPDVPGTDEGGNVTLADPETGTVLLIVTEADIEAAFMEMEEGTSGTAPEDVEGVPQEFLAFSRDAGTWEVMAAADLFGAGTTMIGPMAVGTEHAIVLVTPDAEALMEYFSGGAVEPPPVEVWIGSAS